MRQSHLQRVCFQVRPSAEFLSQREFQGDFPEPCRSAVSMIFVTKGVSIDCLCLICEHSEAEWNKEKWANSKYIPGLFKALNCK